MSRYQNSADTRNKKIEELSARLDGGIKELFASDKYQQFLTVMSKFHRYSVNNCVLIAMQMPYASKVAGFHKWKELGRSVKKGEQGIQILVPMISKQKDENGHEVMDPDTNQAKQVMIGFKPGYVFDISQTDGKELPSLAERLTGEVHGFHTLKDALIKTAAVPVEFQSIPEERNGYYSFAEQKIAVKDSLSEEHTIKTLVHEIAHSRMHGGDDGLDRQTREVQAESVAYIVSGYLGIDASAYSFGYVAGWSKNKDLEELKSSLDAIKKTASEIIDKVEHYTVTVEQPLREEVVQRKHADRSERKYELTDETLVHKSPLFAEGVLLRRIRSLRDFNDVKRGDLGGFIESENNLSQTGTSWVYDRAKVYKEAFVQKDAQIRNRAEISDSAFVGGTALIDGSALITGNARVVDEAKVREHATVSGFAAVSGKAEVRDAAVVDGSASISGFAQVRGRARVSDCAVVCGEAKVIEEAFINECARVCDHALVCGSARVFGNDEINGDTKVYGQLSIKEKNPAAAQYADDGTPPFSKPDTLYDFERERDGDQNRDENLKERITSIFGREPLERGMTALAGKRNGCVREREEEIEL